MEQFSKPMDENQYYKQGNMQYETENFEERKKTMQQNEINVSMNDAPAPNDDNNGLYDQDI